MFYGWRLLLMAMLALPWIQYSLHVSREQARTRIFIGNCGLTR
jgi:hypothetical protein